jgi:hypothetical protein
VVFIAWASSGVAGFEWLTVLAFFLQAQVDQRAYATNQYIIIILAVLSKSIGSLSDGYVYTREKPAGSIEQVARMVS